MFETGNRELRNANLKAAGMALLTTVPLFAICFSIAGKADEIRAKDTAERDKRQDNVLRSAGLKLSPNFCTIDAKTICFQLDDPRKVELAKKILIEENYQNLVLLRGDDGVVHIMGQKPDRIP